MDNESSVGHNVYVTQWAADTTFIFQMLPLVP